MRYFYPSLLALFLVLSGCDTVETTPPEPFFDATFVTEDSTISFSGEPVMVEQRFPSPLREIVTQSLDFEAEVDDKILQLKLSHYSGGGFSSNSTYLIAQEDDDTAGMRCSFNFLRVDILSGTVKERCNSLGFRWKEAGSDSLALYLPASGKVTIDVATDDEVSGTIAVTFDRVAVHSANRVIFPPLPGFEPDDPPAPIEPQALSETVTIEGSFIAVPAQLTNALR